MDLKRIEIKNEAIAKEFATEMEEMEKELLEEEDFDFSDCTIHPDKWVRSGKG